MKPSVSTIAQTYEPMTYAQQREEEQHASEVLAWASEQTGVPGLSLIFVRGMTSCMGKAQGSTMSVRLSWDLWLRATPEKRRNTLIHEASHLVDYHRAGQRWRRGGGGQRLIHDRVWKQIMRSLGEAPSRCHSVDTTGLKRSRRPRRERAVALTFAPPTTLKVGDVVVFGRENGEKTKGRITRLTSRQATISQIGSRGKRRHYPEGTIWKVSPALCRKVD